MKVVEKSLHGLVIIDKMQFCFMPGNILGVFTLRS